MRCRFCSEKFFQVGKLNAHMMNAHQINDMIEEDDAIYEFEEKQD